MLAVTLPAHVCTSLLYLAGLIAVSGPWLSLSGLHLFLCAGFQLYMITVDGFISDTCFTLNLQQIRIYSINSILGHIVLFTCDPNSIYVITVSFLTYHLPPVGAIELFLITRCCHVFYISVAVHLMLLKGNNWNICKLCIFVTLFSPGLIKLIVLMSMCLSHAHAFAEYEHVN